jgi:glycosyltransferase involved in cell wall biosynthesis
MIAVCIPTNSKEISGIRIGYTLLSLLMQNYHDFKIYIRDEGVSEIFADRSVRLISNLLSNSGIEIEYHRVPSRRGVGIARKALVDSVRDESFLLFLDDDMVIAPTSIENLITEMERDVQIGFVQGTKIEADPNRTYWNDINLLNSPPTTEERQRIWFGDAAFILIRRDALSVVDWEIVTRYQIEGLGGEDIAISLMIADKYEAWGIPRAVGWHLSPENSRWIWEAPSDLLQLNLLKGKVSRETLARALPHLSEYIYLRE